MHALGLEFGSAAQLFKRPGSVWNCLWGNALKHLLGSFVRVGYRIPVPDFYLVLHGYAAEKALMDYTKPSLPLLDIIIRPLLDYYILFTFHNLGSPLSYHVCRNFMFYPEFGSAARLS